MKNINLVKNYLSLLYLCLSYTIMCDLSFSQNIDDILKWTFSTNGKISSSPAIGRNGTTIYIVSNNQHLYAINLDGTLKWIFNGESSLTGSPVIGNDNTVYIDSYAINPDGQLKWKVDESSYSGFVLSLDDFALSLDGTIYSSSSAAHAVNPDNGEILWNSVDYAWCGTSPVVGAGGTIYYLTGGLYSLDSNGNYILGGYDFPTPSRDFQGALSPIIDFNDTVYTVCSKKIYAINNDGTIKWSYDVDTGFGHIVISTDGILYSCSSKKYLHAINPDGSQKWTYFLNTLYNSSPAIGRDGTIYLNSFNDMSGHIHAINPDGSKKWLLDIENSTGNNISSPVIGADGTLYVGGFNKLYAISTDCGGLANSCWPMINHDMYHSRNVKTPIPPAHCYTEEDVDQLLKKALQKWDINNDNKKGLAEAIDALQSLIK